MKFWDSLKLIVHEYRYEKLEWILSVALQWLIFTSVFFLLTIAFDLDEVCGNYMGTLYPNGYDFMLEGYGKEDIPELEKMGFYDISFSDVGESGYGVTDDLNGIWALKWKANLSGKDIWNEGLDEILSVLFFCQLSFGAIGLVMFIIMLNNLSNSFAMKLMRRKRYIRMLGQLGCRKEVCQRIYYGFFSIRNVLALILAVSTNACLIHLLNGYMMKYMYISASFQSFYLVLVLGVLFVSMCLMWITFQKQWRRMNEY